MARRHRDPIPIPDDDVELDIRRDNRETDPDPEEDGTGKHGVGSVVLHHTVTAVLVAIVLATGLWSYYQFRRTSFFALTSEAERSAFEVYAVDAQRDRIDFSLDVYAKLYDEYPSSLESLVDEGLLQESDLFYPVGERRFSYQRLGRSYELDWVAPEGPAPDGEIVEDTPRATDGAEEGAAETNQDPEPGSNSEQKSENE